ncbi:helix-turn-helix transcriptional regulator [Alloalcanivorax gelatiniphagus]|uniref:AraC family transcriptional regulator n=1 Tax=Alloalcanivorax gelatiniphagus TaxID=1194167 RepID=A0ABY2XMC0_9GAMM|nr:AraC family transcriptional regulator [Alloalcanivorax gelatiniphagus]TMW13427.1 AraC family transcriptional regulator [Alloalcanivorax gelatiniphagus]
MEGTTKDCSHLPMIAARYGRRLMHFLRQRQISGDLVLAGTGLDQEMLDHPECYLTIEQVRRILEQTKRLLGDELAPFQFGQLLDLEGHGLRGFTEHNSRADRRSLADTIVHYFRVTLPIMDLHLHCDGHSARIQLVDTWELGSLREFVIKIYLGSIQSLTRPFGGTRAIEFDFPTTLCGSQWRTVARGAPIRFGGTCNQVVLTVEPPDMADQVLGRARARITEHPGRDSTLQRVAHHLGMSPRSLRRHLALAGYSFSEIRNEVRRQFATRYLTETGDSLESIADRLGYSDQASFSKAYRSWTGQTPGQVRRAGRPDRG